MFAFTNRYCSEINDNTATLEERIDAPRKLPSGMKTVLLSTKITFSCTSNTSIVRHSSKYPRFYFNT